MTSGYEAAANTSWRLLALLANRAVASSIWMSPAKISITRPSGSMTTLPGTMTPMSRDSPLVLLIPSQSLALVANLTHTLSCFAARATGCSEGSCSEVGRAAHG